nr:helix-turn-helix domain-containing protein [Micrococcus luteus]
MSADPAVITALQRKHLGEFDFEAEDHPDVLASTLHEWLLQWGHRPGIATSLDVHPQTVSHRIKRIKDGLAYDLEDPRVRAELLVLLTAMSVRNAWQAP